MSRYKVTSEWSGHQSASAGGGQDVFQVESADIVDTKNGARYRDGAYRVTKNGRPAIVGKGGTVPYYGESAWSDAERLFNDLVFEARRGDQTYAWNRPVKS